MNRLRQRLFVRALEDRTAPATFTVQNLGDSGIDSLRDCISKANSAAGADLVDFKSGLAGTITLTTGEMAISGELTIQGPGSSVLTVSGNNVSRIFNTSTAATGTAITMSGLTLSNGKASTGGAMQLGDESLTLNQCVISGNSATTHGGALNASGASTVTANGSTFANNSATYAAGVFLGINPATKSAWTSCTISGNTALSGGGIYVGGDLLIEQCTIANNKVSNFISSRGAGIVVLGTLSSLIIRNSTISGNSSANNGGGISLVYFDGVLSIQNSTITNNTASGSGGGIHHHNGTGSVSLESTIVSGNVSPSEADINVFNAVKMKNSAVGSNKGFTMTDLGGNLAFGTNLKLGPLANNGGPTQTHGILAGSPVLDKGSNPASLTTDQRGAGFPRLNGSGIDIGAFEAKATTFTITNANDSGAGSLRSAVLSSNANPGTDTIAFDPVFFGVPRTIALITGEMAISDSVSIDGLGSALTTIDPAGKSRVFNIGSGLNVVIQGFTLNNASSTTNGGAIVAETSTVTLNFVTVSNCKAIGGGGTGNGGAIHSITGATVIANKCVFVGNTASGEGGAFQIFGAGAKLILTSCTVSGNSARQGGGITASNYLLIESSTISNNKTTGSNFFDGGGGIHVAGAFATGNLVLRNSTISGNSTSKVGGGVLLRYVNGTLTLQNCTITNNTAGSASGGIANTGYPNVGSISLESTIVSGNSANGTSSDIGGGGVTMKNSAVGSSGGFTMTDLGGNLPFGTNLLLGVLGNNGGATQTHTLLAGSPALNKGSNPANLTTDQRGTGFLRTTDSAVDIGAYEAQPMTFVVTNANDSGVGSLRNELLNANANAARDTIVFDPVFFGVPRTITLSTGEMVIQDGVTVNAPPALVTINADAKSRIFNIDPLIASDVVAISGLALTNGKVTGAEGGAILNFDANLSLTNVTVTNCSTNDDGGGICIRLPAGALVLTDCTISGNSAQSSGGGIYFFNGGSLAVFNSTISGNKAGAGTGGGIYFFGTPGPGGFTITNSTISTNSSGGVGGGIFSALFSGTAVIRNSTITGNSSATSGGGFAQNSGASAVSLSSSIVAGNTAPNSGPDLDFGNSFTMSANNSLIGIADSGNFTLNGAGNLTGTKAAPLNAKLGPLTNNGGPTPTHALLSASPAINAGSNPESLTTDQRGAGFPRVTGIAIDIGAFETQPTTFVVTNNNNSGAGSLRQALLNANANGGPDTVTFDPAFFNVPRIIALSTGELQNSDEVTIIGPGPELCTISGGNVSRILDTQQAHGNLPVNISGLTFAFGQLFGTDDGAAIFAQDQKLTLSKCIFTSNVASRFGGAISIVIGSLTATDCTFTNNVASKNAGAIHASTSDVILRRCTISGNTAANNGGGAYFNNVGSLIIEDCTFSSNKANSASGGAALNVRNGGTSQMIVRNSTISGNFSGTEGGGVAISSDVNLVVQNSTVTANSTGGVGGGILGSAVITSSIVYGNQATVSGPEIAATTVTASSSLVGSKSGVFTFNGDSFTNSNVGVNPLLGTLANNGGPTLTHAVLAGSPALNNGSNPAGLTNDQRGVGFVRSVGQTDIGAFELQTLPAKVTSVQINDGSTQRSRVTSLIVTFDQTPVFVGSPAAGFQLKRQSDNAVVTLNAVPSGNTVTLTFTNGPAVESTSLADGRYTLTALASQISNLDGDGNGSAGDDYVLASTPFGSGPPTNIFRFFGDMNGDGAVANNDFIVFRQFFNGSNAALDFDNDGSVSNSDFVQFRSRFNGSI